MTLTPPQWTLAFAAALATHALAAALLPQTLSKDSSDLPPPQPLRVSLVAPPAPAIPTPVVTPPTPARPTPPVVRQSEPEASPTPEVVEPPPQPAPVPAPVKAASLAQQESVAAINRVPVAPPQAAPRESTAPVSRDNTTPAATEELPANITTAAAPTPVQTEEPPANVTTAAAPTPVQDVVNLARLKSQYVQTAAHWLNQHKKYPRRAEYLGYEGTVLVTFVVSRHGEILDYEIKRSSGYVLLDKEALAMIRRTRSLPVFPDELVEAWDTITEGFERVPIVVPIQFQLQ